MERADIVERLLAWQDDDSLTTTARLMLLDCREAAAEIEHLRGCVDDEIDEADAQAEIVMRLAQELRDAVDLLRACAAEDLTMVTGQRVAEFLKGYLS